MTSRTNLFRHPSAESTFPSWTATAGTGSVGTSSAQVKFGALSYLVTATSAATLDIGTYEGTTGVPVTVGTTYTFSYYTRGATTARLMTARIVWYDSSGALLSTSSGTAVSGSTSSYAPRPFVTAVAPASAAYAGVRVGVNSPSSSEAFYVDGLLFEERSGASAYFDGASTSTATFSYAWSGTAHESTSTETQLRRVNTLSNTNGESGTTSWAGSNATLSVDTGTFHSGAQSIKMTSTSTSMQLQGPGTASAELQAYGQGTVFALSAWVYAAASGVSVTTRLYNGLNTDSSNVALTANTWTRVSVIGRYNNSDGTASARSARLVFSGVASGTVVYVDDILLEASDTLQDYFDGSSSQAGFTYAWVGNANASSSTETVAVGTRTNLIVTPAFETGLGAWNNYGGESTIAQSATQSRRGTYSMTVTRPSGTGRVTAGHGTTSVGVPTADSIPVSPGESVTVSMYVREGTGAVAVFPMIIWQNATSFTTAVSGTAVTVNSTWQRISVSAVAPAGTTQFGIATRITSATVGQFFYVDDVLVEKSNDLKAFFDGATTNAGFVYAWTGAANASTSTETVSTGGSATASLGIGVQTGPVALGINAPLGVNVQTGPVSLGVTAPLGIDVGVMAVSGHLRTALLGVDVSVGPTSLGVSAPLGVDVETGPVALGVTAPLGINVDADAAVSGPTRTASLGVAVATAPVTTSRTARLGINFDADANWTAPPAAPTRTAALRIGIITPAEAFFTYPPAALGTTPLGKLVSFNVATSAVPLNPAEGSGSTPSVSAAYIKGVDTEFALGETNVLSHGAVGTYEGEIVRLSLPEGSDVASISQDTLLTLLNNEMHLFPFIDAAPSVYTAARAIDYWTQQCGLFLDDVPGDAIAYASGSGHTDSYGAATTARFYEKLVGGTTSTAVLNNRSVKTLGSAVTGTTAFHELPDASVPVSVPRNRKLVASIGLGLRGTGRTTTVTWNMLDSRDGAHSLSISATSAGAITASIGGVPLTSTTVAGNADYRISFSIERVSDSAVVGKLTVHTDDLDGTGTLEFASASTGFSYAFPSVAYLTDITHISAGGSGAEMLRWGTYLTVATSHPMELPAVQKTLAATSKEFEFVSGFEGNVWSMLNEFCAIARLDVSFLDSRMMVTPRGSGLSVPVGNFSRLGYDSERREKYKQVAVVNKQSRAVSTDDAVLWRADSVFQVAAREVFETTVQTGHSILSLVQPVAVDGILPFPYTTGGGQYVVTGADGYIVAPEWWNDNGGLVEVSLTGKEGEIAIKIIAPAIDTVRAPYRISEGAADRPALYVAGSGILNDPKEVHVGTGAKNAREGFDNVFESPFMAGARETYDTAARMAAEYSASMAAVSFELPNDFYTPSRFGQFPSGTRFTDGKRNYRITSATQSHSRVGGSAVPNTTIGDYVASYPDGATIADEIARHAGRTIKQFNIKPLRGTDV